MVRRRSRKPKIQGSIPCRGTLSHIFTSNYMIIMLLRYSLSLFPLTHSTTNVYDFVYVLVVTKCNILLHDCLGHFIKVSILNIICF